MDILIEILVDVYTELMMLVVPERKMASRGYRFLVWVIALVCTIAILALGGWGIVLIFEKKNMLGIIPLAIAVVLSIIQIIFGIISHARKSKAN